MYTARLRGGSPARGRRASFFVVHIDAIGALEARSGLGLDLAVSGGWWLVLRAKVRARRVGDGRYLGDP